MLVHDVAANAHMHRGGDVAPVARRQQAVFPVGEFVLLDVAAQRLAKAVALRRVFVDRLVVQACLLPQAELALGDVLGHALGRCADHRQLEVMDGRRAVHGEVVDVARLHHRDHGRRHAGSDHMPAQHQRDVRAARLRRADPVRQQVDGRMAIAVVADSRLHHALIQVMHALPQREQLQFGAVEFFKGHTDTSPGNSCSSSSRISR